MSADKRESTTLVSEYYNHYLYGTDISSVEDFVAIQKAITNQTTLQEVNQRMKELLPERNDNMVIGSWNIEKDSAYYPTEKELEAALTAGREAPLTPYKDELKGAKLLNELPQKGSIVKEDSIPEFGFTRLSLSNGATVLMKHTDIDKSQVLFKAYGREGWTLYGEDDDPNITMLYSVDFGNNGLTSSQVEKLLAGKRVNLSHGISQRHFSFTGSANPVDLETLMQMIYADFTNINKDTAAYQKAIKETAISLKNRKTDPECAFSDSVHVISTDHHPRFKLFTEDDLAKVSHDRILSIIQEQTSAAQNFTFLFVGNYNDSTIRPLIEQYLASLPNRQELSQGHFINNWLKRDATCHFKRQMETPKTMVHLDWFTEAFPYSLSNYIKAQTACEILNQLYKNIIREENSATYGCYANYYMIRDDKGGCQTGFTADCEMKPEMCDSVLSLMKSIFSNMTKEIDETLFRNAKESLLISFDELVKTANGFWLDTMWRKESTGIDFYSDRRKLIEQLTPDELLSFMKVFQAHAHSSETLMQPE